MEDASIALEFLLSFDAYEANEQLAYLIELNETRKKEQLFIFEEAKVKADATNNVIVVAYSDGWNEGIIGIVAANYVKNIKNQVLFFIKMDSTSKGAEEETVKSISIHLLDKFPIFCVDLVDIKVPLDFL
jgi:single-stranded-DNA-specific exonuclease